jgi:hypothetical protein
MLIDWTRLGPDRSLTCPGLGYNFPVISLLMRKIDLDGAEYTDRSSIILDQSEYSRVSSDKR